MAGDFAVDFDPLDYDVYVAPSTTGYKTIKTIYSLCPWVDAAQTALTDCCFSPDLVAYNKTGVFLCDMTSITESVSDCDAENCYIISNKDSIKDFCDKDAMTVPFDCNNTYICTATCCVLSDDFTRADGADLNLSNGIKEGITPFTYIPTPMYEWSIIDGSTDDWAIDTNTLKVSDSYAVLCLSEGYPWDEANGTDYTNTCPYIGFSLYGLLEGDCARIYPVGIGGGFGPDYCIEFEIGGEQPGKVRIIWIDDTDPSLLDEVIVECPVADLLEATWHDIEILNGLIKVNTNNIFNYSALYQAWRNPGVNVPPYPSFDQSAAFLGTGSVNALGYIAFDDISVRKMKRKYEYGSDPLTPNATVSACDTCPECAWFNGVQPDEVNIDLANLTGPLSILNGSHALDLSLGNYPFDGPTGQIVPSNGCVYYLEVPFTLTEVALDTCLDAALEFDDYVALIALEIGWDGLFRINITTDMELYSPSAQLTGYWMKAGTAYATFTGVDAGLILGEAVGCLQDETQIDLTGEETYWYCDGASLNGPTTNTTVTATIYNIV